VWLFTIIRFLFPFPSMEVHVRLILVSRYISPFSSIIILIFMDLTSSPAFYRLDYCSELTYLSKGAKLIKQPIRSPRYLFCIAWFPTHSECFLLLERLLNAVMKIIAYLCFCCNKTSYALVDAKARVRPHFEKKSRILSFGIS
jgi:hypothetical protein